MLAFKPHKGAALQVAFSPDGASIATCGTKPGICVSDAATGTARWQRALGGSAGFGLAYSPDGTRLAVVSRGSVSVRDAKSGRTLRKYFSGGYAVAFTPDGSGVVTDSPLPGHGAIRTNVETGWSEPIDGLEAMAFNRFRYSPDGRFLAALGESVRLIDTETDELAAEAFLSLPTDGVGALAFHPAAPILVYSDGPKLVAHNLQSNAPAAERTRSKKSVQDAAFTPDGKHLITVSNDATAVLWETAGWTEVREFAWNIGPLQSVAVAPDGDRASCAAARGRVVVWDLDL
jgi:WD40 repeat protein